MSGDGPKKDETSLELNTFAPAQKRKLSQRQKELKADPNWTPYSAKAHRGYSHGPVSTLMGTATSSPAKRCHVVYERTLNGSEENLSQSELNQDDAAFTLQSPHKGVTSRAIIHAETGERLIRTRTIKTHLGKISVFHSKGVEQQPRVKLPEQPLEHLSQILDDMGLPESTVTSITDTPITPSLLKKIQRAKIANLGQRKPANAKVTERCSATRVAKAIGLETKELQWCHMAGHALAGDSAQNFANFFLGTKHTNAIMNDIAESLVKLVLKHNDTPNKLYLSAHVSFEPGYERARLAKRVTWVLKNGPGQDYTKIAKFDFRPLEKELLDPTEIKAFKKQFVPLFFQDDKALKFQSPDAKKRPPLMPLDLQTPSPTGYKRKSRINPNEEPPKIPALIFSLGASMDSGADTLSVMTQGSLTKKPKRPALV